MTITIELAPQLQAELARQAATHGVEFNVYAARLLEDAAHRPTVLGEVPAADDVDLLHELDGQRGADEALRHVSDVEAVDQVAVLGGGRAGDRGAGVGAG